MTGPEHYVEAERLTKQASAITGAATPAGAAAAAEDAMVLLAAAQVHATLALAAATAGSTLGLHGVPSAEWQKASQ